MKGRNVACVAYVWFLSQLRPVTQTMAAQASTTTEGGGWTYSLTWECMTNGTGWNEEVMSKCAYKDTGATRVQA